MNNIITIGLGQRAARNILDGGKFIDCACCHAAVIAGPDQRRQLDDGAVLLCDACAEALLQWFAARVYSPAALGSELSYLKRGLPDLAAIADQVLDRLHGMKLREDQHENDS